MSRLIPLLDVFRLHARGTSCFIILESINTISNLVLGGYPVVYWSGSHHGRNGVPCGRGGGVDRPVGLSNFAQVLSRRFRRSATKEAVPLGNLLVGST